MVPVIHFWYKNPLYPLIGGSELSAVCRRLFVRAIVWHMYSAPEHRCMILDEEGRWEDDGGPGDRHHADDPTGYLRSFDIC